MMTAVVINSQLFGDDLPDARVHALAHFRRPGADHDVPSR